MPRKLRYQLLHPDTEFFPPCEHDPMWRVRLDGGGTEVKAMQLVDLMERLERLEQASGPPGPGMRGDRPLPSRAPPGKGSLHGPGARPRAAGYAWKMAREVPSSQSGRTWAARPRRPTRLSRSRTNVLRG